VERGWEQNRKHQANNEGIANELEKEKVRERKEKGRE